MKKLIALLLTLVMVFALVACASTPKTEEPAPEAPKTEEPAKTEDPAPEEPAAPAEEDAYDPKENPIATCNWLKSHPVVQMMIAGFMSRAQELGYDPLLFAPDEADAQKAYGLLEAGIAQSGVKGVAMHILDESTPQYIKKLADQGIAVVTGHTFVTEENRENYPGLLAFAAASVEEYSKTAALALGEQVGGKGTVAVTCGSFNPTENTGAEVFTKTIQENFPDMTVLDPIEEGFDTPTAIQRATAIMQANPDLVGAFSLTGSGALTWAGAQENAGREICIISMDYARANLDLVKSGEVYGLVAQPLIQEWAMCADLLDTYLRGGEIEFANVLEAPLVTSENVDDYYAMVEEAEAAFAAIN